MADHQSPGVQHQVPADQSRSVGEPVGEPCRCGVQQQPGRADAVAGHDDDLGPLVVFDPVGIEVGDTGRHVAVVHGDLADPAVGAKFDPGALRHGPIGDVGAALRPLGAARVARPEVQALVATVVRTGDDGAVGRPPVPAELVEAASHGLAHAAHGDVGQRWLVAGNRGVAGESRDADVAVVLGEERLQGEVVDGPVVGHPVEGLDAEVGRVETGKVGRVGGSCCRRRR